MIWDQLQELETVELQCAATGFLGSDSHFLWPGDSRSILFTLYSRKTVTARKKIRICLPHPILTHSLQSHSCWAFRIEGTLWSNPIHKYLQTMGHMTSWLSWKSEIDNYNWGSQLVTCQNPDLQQLVNSRYKFRKRCCKLCSQPEIGWLAVFSLFEASLEHGIRTIQFLLSHS
jgi:hypothetical protein